MTTKNAACGAPTEDGSTCLNAAFALGTGRCRRHAGIPSTPAEREAARRASLRHGRYAKGLRTKEDRDFYDAEYEDSDPAEARRHAYAYASTTMRRVAAWEARQPEPSPHGAAALRALLRAIEALPRDAPSAHRCLEPADIARHVEAVLEEDPELFIRRYPPPVQDAIRKAIREGGEAVGGA